MIWKLRLPAGTKTQPDDNSKKLDRRDFIKKAAGVVGTATQAASALQHAPVHAETSHRETVSVHDTVDYPRIFRGRALRMIAFPLGGVAAGSIALGGRGQLRDWEIFNRPNKGFRPSYSFPSIWVQSGNDKPAARVLESRISPPYEGQDGLGSDNVPGLSRLESATFTGEYPLAHIDFEDRSLPVKVALDAFSPFIPHEPDDSGLPVAVLRYTVTNPGHMQAKVGIAFSLDNPIRNGDSDQKRVNTYRSEAGLQGLLMQNTSLPQNDPMAGTIALAAVPGQRGRLSYWTGWPAGRWWNSPLLFWDQFTKSGELGTQPEPHNSVGALCLQQTIAPGESAASSSSSDGTFPIALQTGVAGKLLRARARQSSATITPLASAMRGKLPSIRQATWNTSNRKRGYSPTHCDKARCPPL